MHPQIGLFREWPCSVKLWNSSRLLDPKNYLVLDCACVLTNFWRLLSSVYHQPFSGQLHTPKPPEHKLRDMDSSEDDSVRRPCNESAREREHLRASSFVAGRTNSSQWPNHLEICEEQRKSWVGTTVSRVKRDVDNLVLTPLHSPISKPNHLPTSTTRYFIVGSRLRRGRLVRSRLNWWRIIEGHFDRFRGGLITTLNALGPLLDRRTRDTIRTGLLFSRAENAEDIV